MSKSNNSIKTSIDLESIKKNYPIRLYLNSALLEQAQGAMLLASSYIDAKDGNDLFEKLVLKDAQVDHFTNLKWCKFIMAELMKNIVSDLYKIFPDMKSDEFNAIAINYLNYLYAATLGYTELAYAE